MGPSNVRTENLEQVLNGVLVDKFLQWGRPMLGRKTLETTIIDSSVIEPSMGPSNVRTENRWKSSVLLALALSFNGAVQC